MHPSSSPTILPSAHPPSRTNINPHSHTFSIAPASAANASAFLQVSLSKILGDQLSPFTSTWLASDFRSTLTTICPSGPNVKRGTCAIQRLRPCDRELYFHVISQI